MSDEEYRNLTDHTVPRQKCVFTLSDPGPQRYGSDMLDINRVGNKRDGYRYAVATFSEGTFRFRWLREDERASLIKSLGGQP